ncbi:nucleotidyltransferase family protein [Tindallia californiensis]|uniref:Molybdenum cofactor cytidylyltransferase n=1 Tax=Tindallia californiensis TaxID=159292 RepID=A0A1H3Q5L4_9FIRM|nr:nucleotidyltransferase family protein [Tindallia californiensis]SDZ08533.1 molybdenum cofactor cytidylyltransferase [Tindallia californiensis]
MITAILLASGFSRRMGTEKLLLPIENQPMIERIAKTFYQSDVGEVLLIYRNSAVREAAQRYVHHAFFNPLAERGQSEALKLGLQKASSKSQAYLFAMGDQPFLRTEMVNRLLQIHDHYPEKIIRPVYGSKPGNPVLFPRLFKDELLQLRGDEGGRSILKKNPEKVIECRFSDKDAGCDADTVTNYKELQRIKNLSEGG